jgi:hypothetical protein
MADAVFGGDLDAVGSQPRPTRDTTSTPAMFLHAVQMLDAERAGAGERHL